MAEVNSLIPYVAGQILKTVKTHATMASYKNASSKHVNESCNKDHKALSR